MRLGSIYNVVELTWLDIILLLILGAEIGHLILVISNLWSGSDNSDMLFKVLQLVAVSFIGTLVAKTINRSGVSLGHTLTQKSRIERGRILILQDPCEKIGTEIDLLREQIIKHTNLYQNQYNDILDGGSEDFKNSILTLASGIGTILNQWEELIDELIESDIFEEYASKVKSNTTAYERVARLFNTVTRCFGELLGISGIEYARFSYSRINECKKKEDKEKLMPVPTSYDIHIKECHSKLRSHIKKALNEMKAISSSGS